MAWVLGLQLRLRMGLFFHNLSKGEFGFIRSTDLYLINFFLASSFTKHNLDHQY